jgi:hypothetical protein
MESFYKNWLEKNRKENEEARSILRVQQPDQNISDNNIPEQSTSNVTQNSETNINSSDRSDKIVFENNYLQLFVEKGSHVRQTRFRLQDHLFFIKIKLKDSTSDPPLLRDILNFLEEAFDYILNEIRHFYKPDDHNVAYITLYQQPMISGLNTGNR